jgi:hypothetical protein
LRLFVAINPGEEGRNFDIKKVEKDCGSEYVEEGGRRM